MAERHAHRVSGVWRDAGDFAHDAGADTVSHDIGDRPTLWRRTAGA
jgi:hypothetical protein